MKKKRIGWFVAVLLIGLCAAWVSGEAAAQHDQDDEAEVLLQAAMHMELVEGDLDKAIQLYQDILANHGSNRAVAARALLQMAQSYEKLGRPEARDAYERVAREFADQPEPVTIARASLAALSDTASGTNPSGVVLRQILKGPEAQFLSSPSPDGRLLSYVDWDTGDLAILDLVTGDKRRLTDKGTWTDSEAAAFYSTMSPDGSQVAYTWSSSELRVISVDGGEPRVLARNEEGYIQPNDWAKDGQHILVLLSRADRTHQIALVSVAEGSTRVLKTLDWRQPIGMRFSPDGRYIAYDFPPEANSRERDIFILSTDGSREISLVQHPADDVMLGWAPGGTKVLFASDRTGINGAWMIPVADGVPQGSPELVKSGLGNRIYPLGFTARGAFYYFVGTGMRDVYLATIEPASGRVLVPPSPITQRFMGSNDSPDWSNRGQYLMWRSQRPQGRWLSIGSVDGGEPRELLPDLAGFEQPRWSPDGDSFLVIGREKETNRRGAYRIDAHTGEVTAIVRSHREARVFRAEWSPDGTAIFYNRKSSDCSCFVRRDLDTGRETDVYRTPASGTQNRLAPSPDGRQLAIIMVDQASKAVVLRVVPVAGGQPRTLFQGDDLALLGFVAWTPDGRYLLFGRHSALEPSLRELWRIPVGGGEPQKLDLAMEDLRNLRIHPDGRRIAFTAGTDRSEVWVMENFLPDLASASRQ